ncbi:acyltransferase family protein [Dactylosporangium maewongense]|uniref:Acyltransferase family protein n=1 Tax=Dactylosporangium maewongense TaxID=634393 RepID=A0ABN2D7G0_9ACTN
MAAGGEETRHHRRDIQGLRAVAVTLVVLYHCGLPVPGGFVGVDVFFVVSGHVICAMLLRELAATGRIRLRTFYARRARRLLPALAVVSAATIAATTLLFSPLDGSMSAVGYASAAASLLCANGYFFRFAGSYFQPHAESNPLLHLWTLSIEEQFYLLFPAALGAVWLIARRRRPQRPATAVLITALALAGVASLGLAVCLTYGWVPRAVGVPALTDPEVVRRLAFYAPVTRAWEFLAGAAVAVATAGGRAPRRAVRTLLAWTGTVLLAAAAFGIDADDPFPGLLAAVPVAAALCLLVAGSAPGPAAPTAWLSARPAVALGDLSYSWYLWHWPVIVIAGTCLPDLPGVRPLAALASLVPAVLAYRLVELPIHRPDRRRKSPLTAAATVRLAVVCLLLPAAAGLGVAVATRHGWFRPDIAAVRAITAPAHIDLTAGCAQQLPLGDPARRPCTWPTPGSRGTALLIGDSNAGHLAEPAIAAGRAAGLDVQIATMGGCPLLSQVRYLSEPCRRFAEGSLRAIAEHDPPYGAVIVSNASYGYLNGSAAPLLLPDAPGDAHGSARQREIAAWSTDLARTVATIAPRSPVIVIGAVPQHRDLPGCLRPRLLSTPSPDCGHLRPDEVRRLRDDIVAAERAVAASAGAQYLDLGERLCTAGGGCSAFVDGALVYRDGAHLSVSGAMLYQQPLRDALTRTRSSP